MSWYICKCCIFLPIFTDAYNTQVYEHADFFLEPEIYRKWTLSSDAISVKVKLSSSILLTDFDKYLPHGLFEYLCERIRVIKSWLNVFERRPFDMEYFNLTATILNIELPVCRSCAIARLITRVLHNIFVTSEDANLTKYTIIFALKVF